MTEMNGHAVKSPRRVFMLQIDATSQRFIRENFDALPNLKRIFTDGKFVQTESTAQVLRASAWASFAAAENPGQHGQYFPLQWDPETMSMYRAISPYWGERLDYEPFWYELGRKGYKCVIFDANETVEHEDAPVLEICNWASQESASTFSTDAALLKELEDTFGKRPIGKEVPVKKSLRLSTKLRDQLIRAVRTKCDAIIWLSRKRPWDLYIAGIYELHRAGHNLLPATGEHVSFIPDGALLEVYQAFDEKLAEILQEFNKEPTSFIVYSLHGMEENEAQNHLLPAIMRRLNRKYIEEELEQEMVTPKPGLMSFLRKTVPPQLQYILANMLSERIQDWVVEREFIGSLNWKQTAAFALPAGEEGYIRLNLEGREKLGLVPGTGNAKTHLIEWLRERLFEIKVADSNEQLVDSFQLIEEVYPGPRSDLLPDIILQWKPKKPVTDVYSDSIGHLHVDLQTGRNGNHSADSFAVLFGDLPSNGEEIRLKSITDYKALVQSLLV